MITVRLRICVFGKKQLTLNLQQYILCAVWTSTGHCFTTAYTVPGKKYKNKTSGHGTQLHI